MLLADDDIVSAAWYFCRTQAPTTMPCEVIFDGTQAFKRVAGLSDTRTRNSRTRHLSERTAPEQLVILSWLNIERVVGSYQVRANSAHPEMRALYGIRIINSLLTPPPPFFLFPHSHTNTYTLFSPFPFTYPHFFFLPHDCPA